MTDKLTRDMWNLRNRRCCREGNRDHTRSTAWGQVLPRLAREEGIFAWTSTAGNVIAALRQAEQLGRGVRVVTVSIAGSGARLTRNASWLTAHEME